MTDLNLTELDQLEREMQGKVMSTRVSEIHEQLRPLLDLVNELGYALDWALTYTNARTAEESPAANNPLHKQALDHAIAADVAFKRAKGCTCTGPSMQQCGPVCKYPDSDRRTA